MALELSLVAAALLLGLGGLPHCVAMCAAPCAALTRGDGRASAAFHAARALGYMGGGALVAAGTQHIALLRDLAPLTQPLWTLLHAAALVLGLWMLLTAREPAWRWGRAPALLAAAGGAGGTWVPVTGPRAPTRRSGLAGLAWVAWPCGLLYSALLLAALANGPAGGAVVMGAFALASAPGLWLGPRLMRRMAGGAAQRWGVRGAGLLLAGVSAWALGERVAAWCVA